MPELRVRKSFQRSVAVDTGSKNKQGESGAGYKAALHGQACIAEVIEKDNRGFSQAFRRRVWNKFCRLLPDCLKHSSNFAVRIMTGAVYIVLTVTCVAASNVTAALYFALLSAVCAGEFYYMLRADAKLPNEILGICVSALFPIVTLLFSADGITALFVLYVLALLVWYVFYMPARISDVAVSLFGAVYTGLVMSFAMAIRQSLPDYWGGVLVLGIFASIWGNDAFAYLVGSAIGKHKLAPHISPKKSWEGFIAGLLFSMVCWALLALIPVVNMTTAVALVFGFISGLAGVLGDLVESRIKRNSGFKDSGTIMPGHGGLLDRCDSQFLVIIVSVLMLSLGGCIPNVFL